MDQTSSNHIEETLDPDDWAAIRTLAYKMVDDAALRLSDLRSQPAWQPMPDRVRDYYTSDVPVEPTPLDAIYDDIATKLMPYSMGAIHPRF